MRDGSRRSGMAMGRGMARFIYPDARGAWPVPDEKPFEDVDQVRMVG
jgi:hypothetical protein